MDIILCCNLKKNCGFEKNVFFFLQWHQIEKKIIPLHPVTIYTVIFHVMRYSDQSLYAFLISAMHATCPKHLILFNFIIPIPFGEKYKSSNFSLCNFLQSSVRSPSWAQISSPAPYSQTPKTIFLPLSST